MLESKFVDRVGQDKYLVSLFGVLFDDWAVEDGGLAVSGEVQDGVLVVFHARDVLVK
jgi:hypothetical protein